MQILKNLNYPETPLRMNALEKQLLKFSNDIRPQDDSHDESSECSDTHAELYYHPVEQRAMMPE